MLTHDAVRSAIISSQPYTNLDDLIRAELLRGRLTKQLRSELLEMEDAMRATPGFSEESEEALRDTIDALAGFCSAKHAYKNPPVLPSKDEISQLPRWAQVAFAARCARRVLPIIPLVQPQDACLTVKAAVRAVADAEIAAAISTPSDLQTSANIHLLNHSYWESDADAQAAAHAMSSVLCAIREAEQNDQLPRAHLGVEFASKAASLIADIKPFLRRDFDDLVKLSEWQRWTNDTPVPPEVFGPLWPEGRPEGWPADTEIQTRNEILIEFLSAARDLNRMTENETVSVFAAINAYYIARTGVGLSLEEFRTLIPAVELLEV